MSMYSLPIHLPDNMEFLEWDTNHFRIPVARIFDLELTSESLLRCLVHAESAGLRLVYCFTKKPLSNHDSVFKRYHGILADRKVTFKRGLTETDFLNNETKDEIVREYKNGPPTKELVGLAILSGRYSRFRMDPLIPVERFEALYAEWIGRSTHRELADMVLVVESAEKALLGFVTIALRGGCGHIGLIAVDEAAQGMGLGRHLLESAHHWMLREGMTDSQVITQCANEAACRLYQRAGYKPSDVETVYHFWL